MKIALIAPPFIEVPPRRYGGTELFIAQLAAGLCRLGHEVVVYANGESSLTCEVRWLYKRSEWPITTEVAANLKDLNHTAWACNDASASADIIHLNNAPGLICARFVARPFVYTIHHTKEQALSQFYQNYPDVMYVAISRFQQKYEPMPKITTIHHGLDLSRYHLNERKQPYLSFLGRMTPTKAPHLAIEVARKAGIPLKLAGEVQPMFSDYWEAEVKPRIDGTFIEYVGEADLATKNELLGNSLAFLFPIQWNEPFGLVMLEAMACGTQVLALPGGSVAEVVRDGVSGWICRDVDEMAARARRPPIAPRLCREHVERHFSEDAMAKRYEAVYARELEQRARRASVVLTPAFSGPARPWTDNSVPQVAAGKSDLSS